MKGQWQGGERNTFKIMCVKVKDKSLSSKFPTTSNCVNSKCICVDNDRIKAPKFLRFYSKCMR